MIAFQALTSDQYIELRKNILIQVETVSKAIDLVPYPDSNQIPSIGIGFNLRVSNIRNEVLEKLGFDLSVEIGQTYFNRILIIVGTNYADKNQLQQDLNQVMQDRANDLTVLTLNKRATFSFADESEAVDILNEVVVDYENAVDAWMPAIPDSNERAVLLSLAWNGILNSRWK